MYLKLAGGICFLVISTSAMSVTTRLDSEYFAFKPTQVWAIKNSGKWVSAPRLFTLGATRNKFSIDAREASAIVPAECRKVFSSDMPINPQSVNMPSAVPVIRGAVQHMVLWDKDCPINLWLTGYMDYRDYRDYRDPDHDFRNNFKSILPGNNSKSASVGLIEFSVHGKTTTLGFAILVNDLPTD